jgi:hypothetical protein
MISHFRSSAWISQLIRSGRILQKGPGDYEKRLPGWGPAVRGAQERRRTRSRLHEPDSHAGFKSRPIGGFKLNSRLLR